MCLLPSLPILAQIFDRERGRLPLYSTLGPAGQQKFEAWSFEPRPNYVELDKPKMIPKPGVDRPEGWDDEEDGPWEPPMVKNPDLRKTDTPFYLRPLGEEEF